MTDADFLQEILANPDDDAPRLIYADWLQERGDPRGEFIRVQMELETSPKGSSRYRRLRSREMELLASHQEEWLADFSSLVRTWVFRRGFVDEIEISTRDFLSRAPRIFQAMPVRRAFLRAGPRRMPALAACPYLAKLKSLEFRGTAMGNEGFAVLVASPHLHDLRHLKVYNGNLGDSGIEALARSEGIRLGSLKLTNIHFTSAGLQALAESPVLCDVNVLELPSGSTNTDGLRALGKSTQMARLRRLDLSYNALKEDGVKAIADGPRFSHLSELVLGGCSINDAGVAHIGRADLPELRKLILSSNYVSDSGIVALAQTQRLNSLTDLDLGWNQIGEEGVVALAGSPLLSGLRRLRLCNNSITRRAIDTLVGSPHWNGKTVLDLRRNNLSKTDVEQLQSRFGRRFGTFHRPYVWGSLGH